MIHCIGDSHVSLFNEGGELNEISTVGCFPFTYNNNSIYRTYNIGPALAYNTSTTGHQSNIIFNNVVERFVKPNDVVLISLGQIDCAVHIPKQKLIQKNKYIDIIKETSEKYFNFIYETKKRIQNKIIIYGPVIAGNTTVTDYIYDDKIIAVKIFTDELYNKSINVNGIEILPLYDILFSEQTMYSLKTTNKIPNIPTHKKIKTEYFYDMTHLSYTFLPIVLKKINTIL